MTAPDPLDLLTQAVMLVRGSIDAAGGADATSPTPCTGWDLATWCVTSPTPPPRSAR